MTRVAAALAAPRPGATVLAPQAIGRAATLALHDELALSPKPGLVTLTDNGSHDDMDAHTFMRSLFALRSYFVRIAALGAAGAPFHALQQCGIDAEARMLAATGGVNTHRGAVFMLGLLCAAAGAVSRHGRPLDAAGFPVLFEVAVPALQAARARRMGRQQVLLIPRCCPGSATLRSSAPCADDSACTTGAPPWPMRHGPSAMPLHRRC